MMAAVRPATLEKPRLRGVLHAYAFVVAVAGGIVLVVLAPDARSRVAAAVYVVSISLMLGVSASYHRGRWSPAATARMRRLDHTMIFVAIAGTYTPVAVLALHGWIATTVLVAVWAGALAGAVLEWSPVKAPRAVSAAVYVALGWVAVVAVPALWSALGVLAFAGLLAGGLLYSIGATVYAGKRPDPFPETFGFHEVFHAFVVAAVAVQAAVIAAAVVPRG
jgi:hemolysin III